MTQAGSVTQASSIAPALRDRAKTTSAHLAEQTGLFAQFFAATENPAIKPLGMRDAVAAELQGFATNEIDDIAAAELRQPVETKARLLTYSHREAKPVHRWSPQQATQVIHADRPIEGPAGQFDRSTETVGKSQSDAPTETQKPKPESAKNGMRRSKSHSPERVVDTPSVKSMPGSSARKIGGGARSVSAIGTVQGAGKSLLNQLESKPKPQILRSTKEPVPEQVSKALARVVSDGGGRLTLKLNPQALGEVRIDVEVARGVARATLETQTHAARELLTHDLDALRSALERRGVVVEHLEVAQTQDGAESGRTNEGAWRENRAGDHGQNSMRRSTRIKNQSPVESDERKSQLAEQTAGQLGLTMPVRKDASGILRVDALA